MDRSTPAELNTIERFLTATADAIHGHLDTFSAATNTDTAPERATP